MRRRVLVDILHWLGFMSSIPERGWIPYAESLKECDKLQAKFQEC